MKIRKLPKLVEVVLGLIRRVSLTSNANTRSFHCRRSISSGRSDTTVILAFVIATAPAAVLGLRPPDTLMPD